MLTQSVCSIRHSRCNLAVADSVYDSWDYYVRLVREEITMIIERKNNNR